MARRGRPSSKQDDDKTDIHIIMQLRKVVNLGGNHIVEFRNGDKSKIAPHVAQFLLKAYDVLSPSEKFQFQQAISCSLEGLENAIS